MSTNPVVKLIVGFETTKVQRLRIVDSETEWPGLEFNPYPDWCNKESCFVRFESGRLGEILWYGSPMCSSLENPGSHIGYVVDKLDSYAWITRALLTAYETQVIEIPLDQYFDEEDGTVRCPARTVLQENRNILNFGGSHGLGTTDNWWTAALSILQFAGWNVRREDLHLYLVFDWC